MPGNLENVGILSLPDNFSNNSKPLQQKINKKLNKYTFQYMLMIWSVNLK